MKKAISTIIISTVLVIGLMSQDVYIPDENFKSFLISHSLNVDGNDEISIEEAQSYTGKINCSFEDISDLTGIEAFTALTSLSCGFNNTLTSLDVSNNLALLELTFRYCDISNIDLSNNVELTKIYNFQSKLTTLDISNNKKLEELYCVGNELTSLDLSQNAKLSILDCGENNLTSLDVSQNLELLELSCDDNQLSSIDISNNVNLTMFNSFRNQLTSLDVSNNTELSILWSSDNQITNLDISNNLRLSDLGIYDNNLSELDVSQNTILVSLYCDDNNLSKLDVSQNTMLESLYCDNNNLSTFDISKNINLTFLSIHNNQLVNLNLKNGNNTILETIWAWDNPNLTCIQVDDVDWSTDNWTNVDDIVSFDTECSIINSTVNSKLNSIKVYPNPVSDILYIDSDTDYDNLIIYDIKGQKIRETSWGESYLKVNELNPGLYILHFVSRLNTKSVKFLKQ